MSCLYQVAKFISLKDEAVFKTEEKRNELEAYILRTKSFLASEWTQFIEQNEKKTFADKLTVAEDWLYSAEGYESDYTQLSKQLSKLTMIGDPVIR